MSRSSALVAGLLVLADASGFVLLPAVASRIQSSIIELPGLYRLD